MTASLSSLPAELLREIVRLVEEQDLEAWKRGVEIAEPPPLYRDDAPVWPVDVVAGRFSSFYERGVQALSLVNKQLRALALPHLYEHVTTNQLEHAYFKLKVMNRPPAQLIRQVVLEVDPDESSLYLSLASAIAKLTNLDSVSLDVEFITVYTSRWHDGLDVRNRFESLLNSVWLEFVNSCTTAFARITELIVLPRLEASVLDDLLQRGAFARVQSLALSDASALLSNTKHSFCAALAQLQHLDALELRGVKRICLNVHANHRLWRLRTLTLELNSAGRPEEALQLADTIAPRLQDLELDTGEIVAHPEPSQARPPIFPSLRRLSYRGRTPAIPHFRNFPSLRHISVDITRRSLNDWSASRLAPSRIPSSVETLDIRFSTQFHLSRFPYHPSDYVDAQRTTQVTLAAPPDLTFFEPDPRLTDGFDVFAPRSDAVQNVLEWAQGYFERLRLTRDEAGMAEFAQTLTRVRERQILDSV